MRFHFFARASLLCVSVFVAFLLASFSAIASPIKPDPGDGSGGGQTAGTPPANVAATPGTPRRWEGHVGVAATNVKTGNGNKMTSVPLVAWQVRGGMSVNFNLTNNSQSTRSSKWLDSYNSAMSVWSNGNVTIYWSDGRVETFVKNGASFTPPTGVYETLVANGSPVTSYDVISKAQIKQHFDNFPSVGAIYFLLTQISDENSNSIGINRSSGGLVQTVVDSSGRSLTYAYNGQYATSVTDFTGRQWTFQHDANGNLSQISYPSVNGQSYNVQFGYDASHNITRFQDKRGNASTFAYNTADGSNSLAWEQDPYGSRTTYTYGTSSTTITDANGHSIVHAYDAYGHLTAVTDASGQTERYTSYDANNNLLQKKDKRGFLWNYTYDAQGNQLTAKDPYSATTTVTYNSHNKPLTQTDALANKTTLTYDGQDNPLTTTATSAPNASTYFSASSQISGYANGLPSTLTDPLNHSSSLGYDGNGYLNKTTDANNNSTSATYNALGWKLTSTDALGHTTHYAYDAWGRVTVVTAPDGAQSSTVYDPNGNILRVADADAYAAAPIYAVHCAGNAVGHFGADAYYSGGSGGGASSAADTSAVADPAPTGLYTTARVGTFTYAFPNLTPGQLYTLRLHFVETGYSAPSQRLFNVAVNGTPALSAFDIFAAAGAKNKVYIQEFTPSANSSGQIVVAFTPGAADVPVCNGLEVLPFVHTVANNYDADNRLTSTISGTGNGNGDIVSYAYDGPNGYGNADLNGLTQKGLLSSKTDGNGHTTYYTYTVRNEPYQTFWPDGTSNGVAYDANGNLTVRSKADGKAINYAYDNASRLTDITYPKTAAVHFDYDAGGRKTHMHDGLGDTYWTYGDGLHLTHLNSNRGDVFYSYDAGGKRSSMTAYGVNPSNPYAPYVYGYDPGNRLTSTQNPFGEKTTFAYDAANRLTQKTTANGAYTTYGYDTASQLTDLGYYNALNSYTMHYGYDAAGNRVLRTEADGSADTFGYDGKDQLTSETRTGPVPYTDAFTYDHNGNRLTETVNGFLVQQFSYNAHDVLASGINETPQWDLNGNEIGDTLNGQSYSFTYDDADRLTAASGPGFSDTFTYNGLGLRVTKNDSTGGYSALCDGVSPASPLLSDGHLTFTPGISQTQGTGNGYATHFYIADVAGNLKGMTDGTDQGFSDGFNWDAWGNSMSHGGSTAAPLGYGEENGYQTDTDTGLKLLGYRFYDSRTGRFLSQDPAEDGDNWYAYADNDPINETDPDGLFSQGMPSTDQTASHDSLLGFIGGFEFGGYGGAGSYTVTKYTDTYTESHQNVNGVPTWVRDPGSDVYSQEDFVFSTGGSAMFAGDAAENVSNFFKAVAPFLPGKYHKAVGAVKDTIEALASAKAASATLKAYAKHKAGQLAWRSALPFLSKQLGLRALGYLGAATLGIVAEGAFAASAGWEVGTLISDAPLGPNGQTVTDFWTDQASNSGDWLQQNTTFGH